MDLKTKYQIGDKYRNFTFTKALPIEELQSILYELVHEPTGAQVMHIANDDSENLFCLSFQTLPTNSNGVAHILEHTVLCGSKKFPVKDPFFAMNRRSLNTFMNAMTGSDFTCYPASSQVEKDFYNLLEVYLDAVFFPELKELSFLQEGHRLEFENPNDPTTPLVYRGIVFNEMKGSLSSPETRLWHAIMKSLTPELPYAYNSGGSPDEIPSLTYEALKVFHQKYYHPSHCLFYFYGNLPIEKHLDFIEKHALEHVLEVPKLPPIPHQKRFTKEQIYRETYPLQSQDNKQKTFIAFAWLTTDLQNQEDALALAVLDSILVETDASPLKYALLKSGFCTQTDGYLDLDMSEIPYIIICRGCREEDAENLKKLIYVTLEKIAREGIDKRLIDAAIHQLEFNRLEITGDGNPFGLTLFMRSALAKQHGCPPENALSIHALFEKLQKSSEDPNYFPNLIKRYFLENTHFVQTIMVPDSELEVSERKEEEEKLSTIRSKLTEEKVAIVIKQANELLDYQEEIENQSIECLPKITLKDIPKEIPDFPLSEKQYGNLTVFHHECFTNHIVYADLMMDLPQIEDEDLPYVQLLFSILPELGVKDRNYQENLEYINAYLGGFGTHLSLHPQYENPTSMKPAFGFSGKALDQNVEKLFALLKDASLAPRLDEKERIKELLFQIYTSQQNKLNKHALSYAIQLSVCSFSESTYITQKWRGISYFTFIRDLIQTIDTSLSPLIERLQKIMNTLLQYQSAHLILSCDKQQYDNIEKNNFFDLGNFPSHSPLPWKNLPISLQVKSEARPISSAVAFSALGYKLSYAPHPFAPALSLSTEIMENTYLHKKIREQGGAYGTGATYNPITGILYFYSYRDPHIANTYQVFTNAIHEIAQGKFTNKDLEEAKLLIIQDMDTPISPGSRAITAYYQLRDKRIKKARQEYRESILCKTKKEIIEAVLSELEIQSHDGTAVTFASQEMIEKENLLLTTEGRILPIIPI